MLKVAKKIVPGDPLNPTTTFGSMVSEEQMKTALRYIGTATGEGNTLRLGGKRVREETGGFYVEPTVFDGVQPSNTLAKEEVFGPVLAVTRFKTPEEAIKIANGTVYGSPQDCGRATCRWRIVLRANSGPVSFGSTGGMPATSRCRLAASSSPASAGIARCTRCISMPTSKPSRSHCVDGDRAHGHDA